MKRNRIHLESMDDTLRKVFLKFDEYCSKNDIEYSIDADEHNKQCYRIINNDIDNLRGYMYSIIDDMPITLEIDDDRNEKDGILFIFGLKTINDDQYKSPTRKRIRDQSYFPSSFGKTKSFGGAGGSLKERKKRKNKDMALEDKIVKRIDEEIISIGMPEILGVTSGPGRGMGPGGGMGPDKGMGPGDGSCVHDELYTQENDVEVPCDGSSVVSYTIEASAGDIKAIDNIFGALETGEVEDMLSSFNPLGIIRVTKKRVK